VDWCFLDTSGALGGIVLMWDMRVVEKVKECVGEYTLLVLLGMLKINLLELLLVFMVLIMIVMEGSYGMRWLGYSIGGTCLGALL